MNAPLEGIRVLDLSRMLPGPFCSMLLGDFGADVTKIENPLQKDFVDDSELWKAVRTVNLMTDRNKKSMTLNLKSEEGKQIFCRMAQTADVLLEGLHRPQRFIHVQNAGLDVDRDTLPGFHELYIGPGNTVLYILN